MRFLIRTGVNAFELVIITLLRKQRNLSESNISVKKNMNSNIFICVVQGITSGNPMNRQFIVVLQLIVTQFSQFPVQRIQLIIIMN